MKIKHFCPTWGIESWGLETAAKRVKEAGYDGMEIAVGEKEYELAAKTMKDNGLELILMAFTGGKNPAEIKENYKRTLEKIGVHKPLLINSHTGKDYLSFEQNAEIIQVAMDFQKLSGIKVLHETHRGRFSYSAPATQHYFVTFPNLRITADFSHWVNVSESLLADQAENMERSIARTDHIHSRVGHPEGPQVNDPRAPEWKDCLDAHLAWWDKVVELHRKKGTEVFTITHEFGPAPGYLQTLPYTNQPVASQWDINIYMMKLLKERYG